MKLAHYAALVAVASANVKKDQLALRDEMQSLLTLVKTVEGQNDEKVYDVITQRKEDLKALMKAHPERAGAISQEFKNLLAVVQRVEKNDFDGAMEELAVRKEELMGIHNHLIEMKATLKDWEVEDWTITYKVDKKDHVVICAEKPVESTDKKSWTFKEGGADKTVLKAAPTSCGAPVAHKSIKDGYKKHFKIEYKDAAADTAFKSVYADAAPTKWEEPAGTQKGWTYKVGDKSTNVASDLWKGGDVGTGNGTEEYYLPKSGGGAMPFIIAGVVVVVAGVAVFCICKKKKENATDNKEGGSKALFKTQIKKNATHTESLV